MFKKLLCGFLAMTMVFGLASCDKSEEKETKVDGNQVLGLVMTDVMTWDMTKGIEINGNVNTKLGTYTKSGGFNLKVAMNALTSEPIYEMHVNDAFGVDFDAYIDSTASYIALGDLKVLVPVTTSDDTLTSYASDPSSDPFAELVAQFDFYKLSDTSYYMTAKKEFLTTVNLYLPTLMEQILPFLNVTLNELRIDFQLTKDQHLSKVALKVGTTLGIDDKEINAEFSGNLSVNKEDAMPAVPTDAASYLSVEQIIGQLFQEPITGSVELAIALGELNEILALDISFAVDMEIGYPSITIDVNEKTTINILELAGIPDVVLKKITIAYDEEVSGLAITLYDDKNNVIVSMPLSSSSENPSDDSNGNTPLYAESTTTIEMEIAKDIIKAMLFDFTVVEEEGKVTITFNSNLWEVIKKYVNQALAASFGADLGVIIQQLVAANEEIKNQYPDSYEEDATYQENEQMIQFLTVANSILSIESAKVVVSIAHDAISTTFELTLQSGSNSIRLTMTANLPIEWVSVIVAIGSSMMVGGPTSPTPAYN